VLTGQAECRGHGVYIKKHMELSEQKSCLDFKKKNHKQQNAAPKPMGAAHLL